MVEDKPFDLFGPSAHRKDGDKTPPVSRVVPPAGALPAVSDVEIQEMITKMRNIHDEIEIKLEETFRKAGLDASMIRSYLRNPNNFNTTEWNSIQSNRQAFLNPIWAGIAGDMQKVADLQKQYKKKEMDKSSKERKGKFLGSRRNWIPLR